MFSRSDFADEYPFEPHFLDGGGHRYHYVDEGQGDPLLFVHGNPTWSFAWRHFIRDLSRDYRCLAVDHIGCGLSDKPPASRHPVSLKHRVSGGFDYRLANHIANLQTFLERLDLQNVTLIGHDWGGCIGMGAAVQMPDRFTRLVLCNTAAFRSRRIAWRIAVCRIPLLGAIGVRGLNLFARAALTQAVTKPLDSSVREGYLAPYDSWAHRVAIHRFVQDIPMRPSHPSYRTLVEVEEGLSKLRDHPVLLMWGEQDWCFTTEFLDEFRRHFPSAEVTRFPDAGHYVFEDARHEMIARLRQFLTAGLSVRSPQS